MVKELTSREEKIDLSKIYVIHNGIDIDDFKNDGDSRELLKQKLAIPLNHNVIGIVAGLRPMKRHITFLRAAQRILRERNDVDFVVVGDGPLRGDLEALSDEFGISWHIHFVGWQEDIVPFLSLFDIGVNCSANEGLSNAIMEYMACGVPCVVSKAGGNEELIENGVNGLTFELDNDRELASSIIGLLDDKPKQQEYAERAREIIAYEFSIQKMTANYDRLFSSIYQSNNLCSMKES
jgi:glycosyltransferase involved in cell wall biosynthesis